MSRPALTLPSRTLQAVAQGLRQLHGTPSSWADLLESFGAGVKAQLEPLLVNLTREGAHPRLIATYNIGLSRDSHELFERMGQRLASGSLQEVEGFHHGQAGGRAEKAGGLVKARRRWR